MGLSLVVKRDPFWVEIGFDAALYCNPATTPLVFAAQSRAEALLGQISEAGDIVARAGGWLDGLPDESDTDARRGLYDALFCLSLAEMAVTDWRNVLDDDGYAAEFNTSHLAALFMGNPRAAQIWQTIYLRDVRAVESEKKS